LLEKERSTLLIAGSKPAMSAYPVFLSWFFTKTTRLGALELPKNEKKPLFKGLSLFFVVRFSDE
jgi:hypothetical protein